MIKPPPRRPSTSSSGSDADPPASDPNASEVSTAIGRELKALFDNVASEPVPDKLRQLLDELERKSGKNGS